MKWAEEEEEEPVIHNNQSSSSTYNVAAKNAINGFCSSLIRGHFMAIILLHWRNM